MGEVVEMPKEKVYDSIESILEDGATEIRYAEAPGFKPGSKFRIRSVTAGDMIEWTNANQNGDEEQKKAAGLRLLCKSVVSPAPENEPYLWSDDPKVMERTIMVLKTMRHGEIDGALDKVLEHNNLKVKGRDDKKPAKQEGVEAAKNV